MKYVKTKRRRKRERWMIKVITRFWDIKEYYLFFFISDSGKIIARSINLVGDK